MNDKEKNKTRAKMMIERARSLSPRAKQATVPLYGLNERHDPVLFGSGVLLRMENEVFLLTAAHVSDVLQDRHLYVGVGGALRLLDARYSYTSAPQGGRDSDYLDLAYFHLNSPLMTRLDPDEPISMDDLDLKNYPTSGQSYLILGFPFSKQPRRPKPGASPAHPSSLDSLPSSIVAKGADLERYQITGINPADNLIIGFDKNETWRETGPAISPDLSGHSGGGVWRLPSFLDANPEPAKLAGIAIIWRKVTPRCIVATRIEHCLQGIAHFHPSLRGVLRL